jgi:hypothetical protein
MDVLLCTVIFSAAKKNGDSVVIAENAGKEN